MKDSIHDVRIDMKMIIKLGVIFVVSKYWKKLIAETSIRQALKLHCFSTGYTFKSLITFASVILFFSSIFWGSPTSKCYNNNLCKLWKPFRTFSINGFIFNIEDRGGYIFMAMLLWYLKYVFLFSRIETTKDGVITDSHLET